MAGGSHEIDWVTNMKAKFITRSLLVSALFALSGVNTAVAEIVAKVTDLGPPGKAIVESLEQSREIDFLDKLENGQKVSIDPSGELTIVYFDSGVEYRYVGPAKFVIGPQKPEHIEGQPSRVKDYKLLEKTGLKLSANQKHRDQAALVFRSIDPFPNKIRSLSPNTTMLLSGTPTFSWASIGDGVSYDFVLTDRYGKVVYENSVAGNKLKLSEEFKLAPGHDYSWRVRTIRNDSEYVGSANFEVVTESLANSLRSSQPNITSSVSEQVVYAMLLEQEGFKYDALKQWQRMAKSKPGNAAIEAKLKELMP